MRACALAVPVLALVLTACAPVPEGGMTGGEARARQCFGIDRIDNFEVGRPDQLFVRADRDAVFELNTVGCDSLNVTPQRLALVPDYATAGRLLCTGDWARIVTPESQSPASACRARVSHRLTEAEVAALPARQRP
ncbi:MAG: hypothetical protein ACK4VY_12160 [Brevundimonas sp.]